MEDILLSVFSRVGECDIYQLSAWNKEWFGKKEEEEEDCLVAL